MKRIIPILIFILGAQCVSAQTAVWSTDVAPIVFNNCSNCHRAGGIAPFALMTYQDAVAHAGTIAAQVSSKKMPPWPPDVNYRRLAHERILSQQQIDKIVSWANGGTPQGNPALAPPQPVFSNDGDIPGTADLTIKIPTYTSTANTTDEYRCFVIHNVQSVDKFITAFEAIPGNRAIVHHVLVYADTTHTCAQLDAADPLPGYTNFGGIGTNDAILLGGWVPGSAPIIYPNNFGVKLPVGCDIVLQIHYPQGTQGQVDSTKLRFYFSQSTVRDVFIVPVMNHFTTLINGPIHIPANTTKTYTEFYQIPSVLNLSLIGVAPHMHLIGKSIESFGITPAQDTQKYIRVNDWDFHWQGFYLLRQMLKVAGGTNVYARAFYDNTVNNPENPSNPPQDVNAGESTTDEMMLVYFVFAQYQAGDENIKIDTTTPVGITTTYYHGQQLLEPYPNPAKNQLYAKVYFENNDIGSMDLVDIQGRVVKNFFTNTAIASGYQTWTLSLSNVAAGSYMLKLSTKNGTQTQKVIVQ